MNNLDFTELKNICADILDRRGITPKKLGGDFIHKKGKRVISAKLIKNSIIDFTADRPRFVSDTIYKKWMETPLYEGDVLLTSEAPSGSVAYIKETKEWCLGQRLFCLRTNPSIAYGRYLFYVLQTKKLQHDINARSTGTTVSGIRQSELVKLVIPLPPVPTQKAIAKILGNLDEKIEINKKTNKTLEGIAKTLFKSWFIDFDPVKAKAEGRSTGLPDEISDLFPDSFEDSELGEIPKNWLVSSIDDLNEITMGQSPPSSTYNQLGEGLPFYQGKTDFGFRHPTRRIFCSEPKRLAEQSSTLLSVRAPVGSINLANETCCIGRGVASIKSKKGHHSFTYYLLNGIQSAFDIYNFEGTVFGAINKNDLSSIRVVKSPSNIRELFNEFAIQIDHKISLGIQDINLLTSLRDTLLPKLISGKIKISDAEKIIEGFGI